MKEEKVKPVNHLYSRVSKADKLEKRMSVKFPTRDLEVSTTLLIDSLIRMMMITRTRFAKFAFKL